MAVLYRNSEGGEIRNVGETIAQQGCWSLFKGGFVSNFTGQAELFFEVNKFWSNQLGLI